MRTLLDRGPDLDAVLGLNDVLALGAMRVLFERRLAVPDDVAVAGFDDIVTLRDITPALSTVRVPLVDVGIMATELALSPEAAEPRLVHVDGSVVLRESTPRRG
jgi:LacI family transcriptional regulator